MSDKNTTLLLLLLLWHLNLTLSTV